MSDEDFAVVVMVDPGYGYSLLVRLCWDGTQWKVGAQEEATMSPAELAKIARATGIQVVELEREL